MRILYKVLLLLLVIITLGYGLYSIRNEVDPAKNQPPIPPIPDKTKYEMNLYFGSPDYKQLVIEKRIIVSEELSEEKVIVEELIKGPRNKVLRASIPPETRLLSVNTTEGICYVNLSNEFLNTYRWSQQMNEAITIWSIVNSLTELNEVQGVQILVEGNKVDVIEKYYSLKQPYFRNEELLKKEDLTPYETFNLFIDRLKNADYNAAYEMVEESSRKRVDFVKFRLVMGNYAREVRGYEIARYQTQRYSEEMVLVITYQKKKTTISTVEDQLVEYWKFVYDDNEWKIILPL
ncbi:Sporulation and spore germination [Geosporobacter subterraneus DSM 17957]|uniref:Sporulation and spore germination n=1 Tax=Geosporobacter subterraneus DSM 17957 TaxID=1121919 RepID=A0A1M6BR50_9FIRM|nr:GerMN domain-containing protein [Geosporobacter subterraneus]SHI50998.1 Sporulation and spore germination [Geosporobacter subterraneus DSM 17957]